ncbi:TolB protein [Litorivivens lipolytica]|uniref:Tol-Pal system protein TolB n=1 Tax=Litorivivens lipolytica TaxID=1524264 RepID=A0A7W4Z5N9_9GAMM|nr:Tol-Pal system beta propeller repeat protein TolB [Litorivivens lipolytica]MBB3047373.1 TolB protein [Litorivivens lipolytica]
MRKIVASLLLCGGMIVSALAQAELTIEITRGSDKPVSIAVVPFGWEAGVSLPDDIAAIVGSDLHRTGQFEPMSPADMLSQPKTEAEVFYRDWRSLGVDYLVIGKTRGLPEGGYAAEFTLFDVNLQRKMMTGEERGGRANVRDMAHGISNQIYEKITNIKGAFATKLLYVSARRLEGGKQVFRLVMSDIDGAREQVLLEQSEPILAPTWAPNGRIIAYVSFETTRPAIYMHNLDTAQRVQLTNFRGINGGPVWSPDGKSMAMVLSKDGNPEIYVMDLATRALRRVTNHFAIDTEPDWMDNNSLIFTSDRGGKPQIYRVDLRSERVQRLTFEGDYNARGRVLKGGEGLVMVHRVNGQFHIALQDLKRNRVSILTETSLDESPSMAPNNTILLYATKHQGRGVLAAVSVDGNVHYRLPSDYGDVREPAWSPFLK